MISKNYDSLKAFDIEIINNLLTKETLKSSNLSEQLVLDGVKSQGFSLSILEKYQSFLQSNSVFYEFKTEWNYKPSYVSQEVYSTPTLSFIILFVNNISSAREFSSEQVLNEEIRIPSLNALAVVADDLSKVKQSNKFSKVKTLSDNDHLMFNQFIN